MATLCSGAFEAAAKPRAKGLRAGWASGVRVDGVPKEHSGDWRDLTFTLKGDGPSGDDFQARALVSYDDDALYVAADVRDDDLVGGGDYVELLLGIPGGTTQSFRMYPGVPGKSRAKVSRGGGGSVRGAQIVEAPTDSGYTLEARIPWKAVPKSRTLRVGYRGALFAHDADGSRRVKTIIGSAGTRRYAKLPPLSTEPELALGSGLLRERNIKSAPSHNLLADLVGDKMLERVLVYGPYLVVLGPGYRDGREYFYRDLGTAGGGALRKLSVRDYTGDRKADVLLRRRARFEAGTVESLQVLSYASGSDTPEVILNQEIGLTLDKGGRIENVVRVSGSGRNTRITIRPGRAKGIDAGAFRYEANGDAKPLLLPWGRVASRSYGIRGDRFVVLNERSQKGADRPPPPPPPPLESRSPGGGRAKIAARPRSSSRQSTGSKVLYTKSQDGPATDRVYALYRKKHGVRGPARFDLRANLAEDSRPERLVVHGRALVLFGEGYRGGRSYAAVEMANFERPADIRSVTTRDITGDGKHEVVVRGVIRSPLPADVGSGTMKREVLMIYKVVGGQLTRVLAAEVKRTIGNKFVAAQAQFRKNSVVLRPGKARGYDEQSYPWAQKTTANNGFEPLLLPWGGVKRVRLRFDGHTFVRR